MKLVIYCCPPTQRKDQEDLNLKLVIPGPDYITGNCEKCGMQVWMGPEIQRSRKERPGPLYCFMCARLGPRGKKIKSLGGQSAQYIRQSIKCPQCGMVSHHPRDIAEQYCGNCNQFHIDMKGGK